MKNQSFPIDAILWIIFIPVLLILSQCKGSEVVTIPTHDSISVVEREVIEDHSTWTNPESLLYQFAFECDSNYNVLLKKFDELNTGVENEIEIKEVIRYRPDKTAINRLEVDISVLIDSIEVQNRTIKQLKNQVTRIEIPYPVDKPVKFVPRYHKFTAWAFPALVILILFGIYLKIRTGKFLALF